MNTALLLAGGFAYAVLFWVLGAWRPRIALALILAAAPFQNDLSGGGPLRFSLAEIHLLLALPLLIARGGRWRFGPTVLPALAYLGGGILSSLANWRPTTLTCLLQISIYLVVLVMLFASLARTEEDFRLALHGNLAVCLFLAVSTLALRTPFVFGLHKNGVGATLATGFVIACELWMSETSRARRRAYLLTLIVLAIGCFATLSRGSWMAAGTGVFILFLLRREFARMLRIGLVLAPLLAIGWSLLPDEAKAYATGFEAERWNIQQRYLSRDYALQKFQENPLLGVGVGLRKEYDATNFALLTMAETGVLGVLTMGLVHFAVARLVWRTHRRVPPRSLAFSVTVLPAALIFGKLAHGMVDHYWGRGSLTVAWATLGMAVLVAERARRARSAARVATHATVANLLSNQLLTS